MDYFRIKSFLDGGRDKYRRKYENNTYAVKVTWTTAGGGPPVAIKLHNTNVLTFYKDGRVAWSTGGWSTVTTKARMNNYGPEGWRVGSERGDWYLYGPGGLRLAFYDGIVTRNGGATLKVKAKCAKLEKQRIVARQEAAKWARAERKWRALGRAIDRMFGKEYDRSFVRHLFTRAQVVDEMPPPDAKRAWHFVIPDEEGGGVTMNGGVPVVEGQTLRVLAGPVPCEYGLHSSDEPSQAFGYCSGPLLCRVAIWGPTVAQDDKQVSKYRRVLAMMDVSDLIAAHMKRDHALNFDAAVKERFKSAGCE